MFSSTHQRQRAGFIALAPLVLAAAAHADIYHFTINSQSSLHGQTDISAPLTGSLIGNHDPVSNPTGTQTRPGLFGGTGNIAIPIEGYVAVADDSTTHPAGAFTLDINPGRGIASLSGLNIDYLAGANPDLVLELGMEFATFRTFSPNSLFIGGFPFSLPLMTLATLDTFSVEQLNIPAIGQLVLTGKTNEYRWTSLAPVRLTVAGSILGQPLPTSEPISILLPISATITLGPEGHATATWSVDWSFQRSIPGPLYTLANQPLDLPTILPPGGTAHLLINGELGDLGISLSQTGSISAAGIFEPGPCRVDFNNDNHVNVIDFVFFIAAFNAGEPRADFNGDGLHNTVDFIAYLNAYAVGCH
jgi:hypothetical protein